MKVKKIKSLLEARKILARGGKIYCEAMNADVNVAETPAWLNDLVAGSGTRTLQRINLNDVDRTCAKLDNEFPSGECAWNVTATVNFVDDAGNTIDFYKLNVEVLDQTADRAVKQAEKRLTDYMKQCGVANDNIGLDVWGAKPVRRYYDASASYEF